MHAAASRPHDTSSKSPMRVRLPKWLTRASQVIYQVLWLWQQNKVLKTKLPKELERTWLQGFKARLGFNWSSNCDNVTYILVIN